MTIDEVISQLELDDETAKLVKAKAKAEKAAALKAQKEYDAIMTEKAALETELNGGGGKLGAKEYQKWYNENYAKVQDNYTRLVKYVERYGDINAQPTTTTTTTQTTVPPTDVVTKSDLEKLMNGYTTQWSSLVKGIANITTKHQRNGRKTDIDVEKISQIAAEKFNGDVNLAYDEWDKPEAEKAAQAAEEKRINAEVEKRMKAAQTNSFFPSTEPVSTGVSPLSRDRGEAPKYDRAKVIESAISGLYEPATVH